MQQESNDCARAVQQERERAMKELARQCVRAVNAGDNAKSALIEDLNTALGYPHHGFRACCSAFLDENAHGEPGIIPLLDGPPIEDRSTSALYSSWFTTSLQNHPDPSASACTSDTKP